MRGDEEAREENGSDENRQRDLSIGGSPTAFCFAALQYEVSFWQQNESKALKESTGSVVA